MTTEEIIQYVLHTPGNTNPNFLRGVLKKYQLADSDEISEEVCEELLNKTYGNATN